MLKSRPSVPNCVPAVRKMEPSAGTVPWTNWSADCSSSIVTVALDEEEDDDVEDDEDEEPEVMVLDSSARSLDDELEHRNAPTVMASDATEPVLPSLTKVTPFAAVKGAPRGLVAALSVKAWQTAVGSLMLAATACCGVVKSWSSVTLIWIEESPSPVLIWTRMVLAWRDWRGSADARLARRVAEVKREEVLMLDVWLLVGCWCTLLRPRLDWMEIKQCAINVENKRMGWTRET